MRRISRSFARFTLALVALCLFHSGLAVAQTQEPAKEPAKPTAEVEQLKQRLQQLEQTVSDLKGQITAIEEAKSKPAAPAIIEATYSEPPKPAASVSPEKAQNNPR